MVELWHICSGNQWFFSPVNDAETILMKHEFRCMTLPTAMTLAVLFLLTPCLLRGEQIDTVDKTVLHLISYVSGSGLIFIRNAGKYTSVEAAEHMNNKYQHFRQDIKTAEGFIERCASKSLLSGKPYLVINAQGEQVRTSEWLLAELGDYRARNTGTSQQPVARH
jgi:hypothetical protein